jgi:hypothetical protein
MYINEELESKIIFAVDMSNGKGKGLPRKWNEIREKQYNGEPNFGILTGDVNDIVVIDVDRKEPAFVGLIWLQENFGRIEEMDTLVTRSMNGGYHVFFRYNEILKNAINIGGYHIDILSDGKFCYGGEGYEIVNDSKIRAMTNEEMKTIQSLMLSETIEEITPLTVRPKEHAKINRVCSVPKKVTWCLEKNERGIKAVPDCKQCLVNPCKEHAIQNHSALFVNNDQTVVKTCFSCGSVVLEKREAMKILNVFNVIMDTQDHETTVYKQLMKEVLEVGRESCYKREKGTGVVYKRVKPYAYVRYMEPMDFLNDVFYGDDDFKSHVQNMDNLVKFMKQYDDPDFPFMKFDEQHIGFRNGILNKGTVEFTNENDIVSNEIVVKKYIDQDFLYSVDTPLLDSVLDYQFTPEVRDFIYMCLGRMFGIHDDYGFMLYLLGEPGCGKSLIIDVLCECFSKVGSINSTFEEKFGLSFLYDKDIIVSDDLPKNISKILPQQTFQSMVTGGKVSIAVKGGEGFTVEWRVPMIFASNYLPDYVDKGQVSRRVLIANFERNVYDADVTLRSRIVANELPAFIYKSLFKYKTFLEANGHRSIWDVCPAYFKEQREEMKMERNALYKFLVESTEYKENGMVRVEEVREKFGAWLGRKVVKLDSGTFGQVNRGFVMEVVMTCKHCFSEARRGCCDKYKNAERTRRTIVRNMKWVH